jgi:hypothetical protein
MVRPPSDVGGENWTSTTESPSNADTPVGAPGTVAACTSAVTEGEDSGLSPSELVACTVHAYVDSDSSVSTSGDPAPVLVRVSSLLEHVAV